MFFRNIGVSEGSDLPRPERLAQGQGWRMIRLALGPGQEVPAHTSPGTVVLLVVSGQGRVRVGDQVEVLAAGDAAVCPPGVPHGLAALPDGALVAVAVVVLPA